MVHLKQNANSGPPAHLLSWVRDQRERYNDKTIPREHEIKLQEIDPLFFIRSIVIPPISSASNTDTGFAAAAPTAAASNQYGGFLVPLRDGNINNSEVEQLQQQQEAEAAASALQLQRSNNTDDWEFMFRKLVAYKVKHKDTMVPRRYEEDKELGWWVNKQRICYKRGILLKPRRRKMKSIGFVWYVDADDDENKYNRNESGIYDNWKKGSWSFIDNGCDVNPLVVFEEGLAESRTDRESGTKSASSVAALTRFKELPSEDRECLEQGIDVITITGALAAAKKFHDNIVRHAMKYRKQFDAAEKQYNLSVSAWGFGSSSSSKSRRSKCKSECKEEGCEFSGFEETGGYCSHCWKQKDNRSQQAVLQSDANHCKEEGCEFFGSKKKGGYCSECWNRSLNMTRTNNKESSRIIVETVFSSDNDSDDNDDSSSSNNNNTNTKNTRRKYTHNDDDVVYMFPQAWNERTGKGGITEAEVSAAEVVKTGANITSRVRTQSMTVAETTSTSSSTTMASIVPLKKRKWHRLPNSERHMLAKTLRRSKRVQELGSCTSTKTRINAPNTSRQSKRVQDNTHNTLRRSSRLLGNTNLSSNLDKKNCGDDDDNAVTSKDCDNDGDYPPGDDEDNETGIADTDDNGKGAVAATTTTTIATPTTKKRKDPPKQNERKDQDAKRQRTWNQNEGEEEETNGAFQLDTGTAAAADEEVTLPPQQPQTRSVTKKKSHDGSESNHDQQQAIDNKDGGYDDKDEDDTDVEMQPRRNSRRAAAKGKKRYNHDVDDSEVSSDDDDGSGNYAWIESQLRSILSRHDLENTTATVKSIRSIWCREFRVNPLTLTERMKEQFKLILTRLINEEPDDEDDPTITAAATDDNDNDNDNANNGGECGQEDGWKSKLKSIWTLEEIQQLHQCIELFGNDYKLAFKYFPTRSARAVQQKFQKYSAEHRSSFENPTVGTPMKRGIKKHSKCRTYHKQWEWYDLIVLYDTSYKSMNTVEFLQSPVSGTEFTGTDSEKVGFCTRYKEYINGKLENPRGDDSESTARVQTTSEVPDFSSTDDEDRDCPRCRNEGKKRKREDNSNSKKKKSKRSRKTRDD